jgi:hypothetical protein
MAAALSNAQLQQVQAQLSAHPEILKAIAADNQLFQHQGRQAYILKNGAKGPADILKQYGINFPDAGDYQIQQQPDGSVTLKRQNWFQRNADWILPVATIGTGGAVNALTAPAAAGTATATDVSTSLAPDAAAAGGGGAGAAGGGAADAGTLGSMAPGAELPGGLPSAAMPAAAGTGFGAALKAALPTIIGAGASLGGAAIASHGNTEAAKIAAAQQQAALDQAKLIYQQQRADLSPYRQIGASALGPLSFGLGIAAPTPTQGPFDTSTGPQGTTVGMPTTTGPIVAAGAKDAQGNPLPNAGQNQVIPNPPTYAQTHAATLSTIGASANIRDPQTGLVHVVPHDQVGAAMQNGGVLV